jgi:multiple sugar transport system permease protein
VVCLAINAEKEKSNLNLIQKKKGIRISSRALPWVLVAPCLTLIAILSLFPLFYAISESAQYHMLTDPMNRAFIGFDNYRKALSDPYIASATVKTIVFTLFTLLIEIPFGTAVAFLLFKKFKGQGIVRTLLIVPMACAPLAIGLIWRSMYHPEFGVYTFLLKMFGVEGINFLGSRSTAMASLVAFDVWQWTPFVTFIVLAGLQSLRREPYEAAAIDGASRWQVFSRLTFPMLIPLLFVAFLLRLLDLIRYYDGIYALTMGGPGTATETLSWYLYRIGFKYMDMGFASSISIIFMFVAMVASVLALKWVTKISE